MKSFFTFNTLPIYDVYVKFKLLSKPTDLRTQGDRFPALKSKKKKNMRNRPRRRAIFSLQLQFNFSNS